MNSFVEINSISRKIILTALVNSNKNKHTYQRAMLSNPFRNAICLLSYFADILNFLITKIQRQHSKYLSLNTEHQLWVLEVVNIYVGTSPLILSNLWGQYYTHSGQTLKGFTINQIELCRNILRSPDLQLNYFQMSEPPSKYLLHFRVGRLAG